MLLETRRFIEGAGRPKGSGDNVKMPLIYSNMQLYFIKIIYIVHIVLVRKECGTSHSFGACFALASP